jgi:hypothetical protein
MKRDYRSSGKANDTLVPNVTHDYHEEHLPSDNIDLRHKADAFCTSSKHEDDSWILDSACFYHIFYVKKFFHLFLSSNGSIFMGNDQAYEIEGVGFVRIHV